MNTSLFYKSMAGILCKKFLITSINTHLILRHYPQVSTFIKDSTS